MSNLTAGDKKIGDYRTFVWGDALTNLILTALASIKQKVPSDASLVGECRAAGGEKIIFRILVRRCPTSDASKEMVSFCEALLLYG